MCLLTENEIFFFSEIWKTPKWLFPKVSNIKIRALFIYNNMFLWFLMEKSLYNKCEN
jgi:hypothetical protein